MGSCGRRGEFLRVDFPGHINTIAQRILPDGTILGCYHDNDTMGSMHGMTHVTPRRIRGDPGRACRCTTARLRRARLIVGLFTDMDGRGKGYFIDRGRLEPFEVPGAATTAGGTSTRPASPWGLSRQRSKFHGFQFDGTDFGRIDFPGATATRVFGINAGGDMVGNYVDISGRTHGFIAHWGPARK